MPYALSRAFWSERQKAAVARRVQKKPPHRALPSAMATLPGEGGLVNLSGDYGYLGQGYYLSQELQDQSLQVHPTCREAVDAYVVPLFLEKARLAGLPVPAYYITNDYFEPPVLVDTMNPFMERHSVVPSEAAQDRIAKSLTRNYTYPLCCQPFPEGTRITHFNAVLGWSANPRYRDLACHVWQTFGMPLARVRVLALKDGAVQLSALGPAMPSSLSRREHSYLMQAVEWPT